MDLIIRKFELTFKSTDDEIKGLLRQGRLKHFQPILGSGEIYRRRLFLHPELVSWMNRLEVDADRKEYFEKVMSLLKAFVIGEDFDDDVVCKLMKPHHHGIYELRITFDPQHRIFGGFLRVGEFVALAQETRDKLSRGQGFAGKISRVDTLWKSMFPYTPLINERCRLLEDFCNED